MEAAGYILLRDSRGLAKSALKKLISAVPYSEVFILRGELVTIKQSSSSETKYQLHRDPNVYVNCTIEDIAPLNQQEFLLMEGIEKPADRVEVFNDEKLDWGSTLKQGYEVYVILNLNSTQYASTVVHYKGVIGSVPGIQFGVEHLEGRYRTGKYGTTDGTFQGHRYFKCPDNCGLFVSLAQLSKEPFRTTNPSVNSSSTREASKPRGTKSYAGRETGPPADNIRFKSSTKEISVDVCVLPAPSEFHIGQHVKFHDKKGELYRGEICWTGRGTPCGLPECNVVGIKTDRIVFRSDFDFTLQILVPSVPKNHLLFLPESFVADDPASSEYIGQHVKFYDKRGEPYLGEICWTGRGTPRGQQECNVVGIKTERTIFKSDFEHRIQGMDQLKPSVVRGHLLFLPKFLVDDVTGQKNSTQTSEDVEKMKEDKALMKQQEKLVEEAEKANRKHHTPQDFESERMKVSKAREEIRRMEEADKNKKSQDFRHLNPVSQQPFPPSATVNPEKLNKSNGKRKNEELPAVIGSPKKVLQQQGSLDEANNQAHRYYQDHQPFPSYLNSSLASVNPEKLKSRKKEAPADVGTPKKVLKCGAVEIYIDDVLGIGAYGKVCRAKNGQLLCAAKLLHDTMFQYNDPGIHTWAKKFEDECKFLSTIKHPNIVQYLDTIKIPESGRSALLMELMDKSLTHFLKQSSGPLPYRTQVNICHDVALALAYLHIKNVIHRDLSSNNVLLAGAGHRAKVTDFGMFKLVNMKAHMTATKLTQTPGTPPYMPPEALIEPPRYSNKLDCFSHGVLTIQIITRNFPDPGNSCRYIDDPNYPDRRVSVSIPEKDRRKKDIDLIEPDHPLLPIAMKCIKDKEEERPSANELCKQLGSLKKGEMYNDAKSPGSPKAEAIGISSAGSQMEVGSLIRIPSYDITHPWRHGTIKWIGNLENIQGKIAGIELDDPMDCCTDGTFAGTGQKFFNCPQGRGMYYLLENLKPSEMNATLKENPLRDVVKVTEEYVSNFIIDKYIGNRKGIQGHQNSSCLDATLFGLFALSFEFDSIFLQGSRNPNDAIRQILWRNIINPLRKHGVVRFESVLKLQEELLERMKRIPKDPREFLKLIFEYPPPAPHFISIRHPRGIEQNYFVELFLEADESMKVPSIGGLLAKMFFEQQISFTEVPSKLLIQVPKRDASMLIPFKVLNVAKIVDLDIPYLCQFCGSKAGKSCTLCINDFFSTDRTVHFCEDCCGKIHSHPNRKGHPYRWCDEMEHLFQVANLELLSVICVENNHYVCFTRHDNRWIFFDSMANRVGGKYYIPKVEECTADLNEWVYPRDGDFSRLLKTSPHELPELVRRFTQDIYMCVYVQPDLGMY